MAEFIQFIPIVEAQNLDGVAQPTFGNIEVSSGGGTTSSVLLSSDKTSVKVGDTFKVKVQVKTNTLSISEYKIVVSFDRSAFTVIDQDTTTAGTQVKLLDDVFTIEDIENNNKVSTDGVITVNAKTASGNSFQVNKDVVEITFQAQAESTSTISVTQGTGGTQLARSNSSTLPFTANEVSVKVAKKTTTSSGSGTPIDSDGGTTGSGSNSGGIGSSGSGSGVSEIPNTAIGDGIAPVAGLFIGAFLIGTGIVIAKNHILEAKKHRKNLPNTAI